MTWFYDAPGTPDGALQRGLGRAAFSASREAVLRCVVRDHRWDRQVDERAVYLARLVGSTRVPAGHLIDLLRADSGDDENNLLDVLVALGRGGDPEAVEGLRAYVGEGPRWVEVLEQIACEWPRDLWDDLLPTALQRLPRNAFRPAAPGPLIDDLARLGPLQHGEEGVPLGEEGTAPGEESSTPGEVGVAAGGVFRPISGVGEVAGGDVFWPGVPWKDWAMTDDRIAVEVAARRAAPRPRPRRDATVENLLADVVNGDEAALRELNCRGPQPALLPLLGTLPVENLRSPLRCAVELLGEQALPVARRWAAIVGHPLRWTAYRVLSRHGDDSDVPALIAGWDWLDTRPGDRCGYDQLATGLARIGGRTAHSVVPRLHRLWHSPHSYERAAYLRALMILDGDHALLRLTEGLWDCESAVREIAAGHVPLEPAVVDRLAELAADPMEAEPVRAAARLRAA